MRVVEFLYIKEEKQRKQLCSPLCSSSLTEFFEQCDACYNATHVVGVEVFMKIEQCASNASNECMTFVGIETVA